MQGLAVMTETPDDGVKRVLNDRKLRRKSLQEEMRTLSKHKKRIKARLVEGAEWPIDSATGQRADIDHEDVMAPLPDDLKMPIGDIDEQMQKLRAEVEDHQSFAEPVVPIDRGVMLRRQAELERERQSRDSVRGEAWTEEMVEARIEEAFKTLFRASVGKIGPREFGNAMPTPVRQMSDLVAQAGTKSLRRAMVRMRQSLGPPTGPEVQRMEEALGWAVVYLRDEHPDLATFTNFRFMWSAWGANVSKKCRELGVHRQVFYRNSKTGIRKILEGLKRDGRAPT